MRVSRLLVLSSLFALPTSLLAQEAPALLLSLPNPANCPVGFTASRLGGPAELRSTSNAGGASKQQGLGLQLFFLPETGKGVKAARVTVRGMRHAQVVPASGAAAERGEASERFTLQPGGARDEEGRLSSIVYARELNSIASIELEELTYADGTAWHAARGAACRIAPDPVMLVSAGLR